MYIPRTKINWHITTGGDLKTALNIRRTFLSALVCRRKAGDFLWGKITLWDYMRRQCRSI